MILIERWLHCSGYEPISEWKHNLDQLKEVGENIGGV